jgi:hypothetical protein
MGVSCIKSCPQRTPDRIGFKESRVDEQHQIHQIFDTGVVTILAGEGVGVYLFSELLSHRVEDHPRRGDAGPVKQLVSLDPVGLPQHDIAQTHVQVESGKGPPCQPSLDGAADTTPRCSGSLLPWLADQENKTIFQVTLRSSLQALVDHMRIGSVITRFRQQLKTIRIRH